MGGQHADSPYQFIQYTGGQRTRMEDPKKTDLGGESEDLFNRVFSSSPGPAAMPLSDGRLTIKMPNNWQKVDDGKLPVGVSSVGCRPKDNANVELNIYYRGSHLDPEAAKRFHDLLSKPPHLLSSDELKQVSQALRDKANPENFKILSAKTETINGRTVLSIEGSYRQFDVRAQVKYVDSEADGSIVREVSYTAPAKDYAKYILAAQKSFSSLIGK